MITRDGAPIGSGIKQREKGNPRRPWLRMTIVTTNSRRRSTVRGTIVGLLTAAVAVGVAQLAAGLIKPQASPVIAVGQAAIDHTPPPVKNFAVSTFGSNDKTVLLGGILVLLAVYAAWIGTLALRRLGYGLTGLAVFAAIGLLSAVTRPNATAGWVVPTLAGAAAGVFALVLLTRAAEAAAAAPADAVAPAPAPAKGALTPPDSGRSKVISGRTGARRGDPGGRPPGPAERQPDRRRFLVTGGAAAATAAVTGLAGRELATRTSVTQARSALRIPAPAQSELLPSGADLGIPGLSPFVTPSGGFYRVDTALLIPEVAPQSWRLRIHGMVQRDVEISFAELLRRPLVEHYVTLCCVSNPVSGPYIGNAKWLGASLASLIREAGPRSGADQLLCTSADGFTSGTPAAVVLDGRAALLAVAMNGAPLPVAHGFPARMVVPGLYGYVSATKWVTDIEVTTFAASAAYWAQRGWSQQAPIKTESRIDVPTGSNSLKAGRIPVAGVAWAQHKGIAAVEVQVDNGPWNQARLAAVPGIDTWRQWVWDWDAAPGGHTLQVRATDATGYTQTAVQEPPEPNGATGYSTVSVTVSA
jgi:DMSO/TMAO reductase YedYZ molybdopterin-dependent catalytic subunit